MEIKAQAVRFGQIEDIRDTGFKVRVAVDEGAQHLTVLRDASGDGRAVIRVSKKVDPGQRRPDQGQP